MSIPALSTSAVRLNMFDLINLNTGQSLLSMHVTDTLYTQMSFNGIIVSNSSLRYNADLSPTHFGVHVYVDEIRAVASSNLAWVVRYPIVNTRLTDEVYSLYISNPSDASVGGSAARIKIVGE